MRVEEAQKIRDGIRTARKEEGKSECLRKYYDNEAALDSIYDKITIAAQKELSYILVDNETLNQDMRDVLVFNGYDLTNFKGSTYIYF